MLHVGRIIVLAVALSPVGVALAKDLCVSIPALSSQPFVGKGAKVPGKGKCKPFDGFEAINVRWLVSGTGCTSSDGTTFRVAFAAHSITAGTAFDSVHCAIPYPSLTGGSCLVTRTIPSSPDDEIVIDVDAASAEACTFDVP